MKEGLALILTKLALACGLYAYRAERDPQTARAVRRADVAAKAHTRTQARFTTAMLDGIDAAQDGSAIYAAADEAARVSDKLTRGPVAAVRRDIEADAERMRNAMLAGFKGVSSDG